MKRLLCRLRRSPVSPNITGGRRRIGRWAYAGRSLFRRDVRDARHGLPAGMGLRELGLPIASRLRGHSSTRPQRLVSATRPLWLLSVASSLSPTANTPGCRPCSHRSSSPPMHASIMAAGILQTDYGTEAFSSGGTGARFARAVIIVAGVCALVASLVTFVFVASPNSCIISDVVTVPFGYRREQALSRTQDHIELDSGRTTGNRYCSDM